MHRCLISFGANLGDALGTIEQASELLRRRLSGSSNEYRLSRFFRTPPVGGPSGQPPFVNAVAAVETPLSAWEVWQAIREVEEHLGRVRFQRWEARRIDLDILLYGSDRIWTPQLKIPHPRMCMRRFILIPASDVAPDWLEPVSGRTIGQLAQAVQDGKGNLVLCADRASRPEALLDEVSRLAVAQWRRASIERSGGQSDAESALTPQDDLASVKYRFEGAGRDFAEAPNERWVSWVPQDDLLVGPGASQESSNSSAPRRHESGKANFLDLQFSPASKLFVYLADHPIQDGVQWEDQHRRVAILLGMQASLPPADLQSSSRPSSPPLNSTWGIAGPRYLLATEDRDWAIHELVAALEAMDCPVEPMS